MKKETATVIGLCLLLLVILSPFSSLVSAADVEAGVSAGLGFIEGAGGAIASMMQKINWTADSSTKILLGILLYIIIYSVLSKMKLFKSVTTTRIVPAVASLIIVILAFTSMPAGLVETIVLQYGAMGAAILTMIPFLILLYFSFTVAEDILIAKITWVFYIVYYFGIFVFKIASEASSYPTWSSLIAGNIFYIGAIFAGIIVFSYIKQLRMWKVQQNIATKKEKGTETVEDLKLLNKLKKEELKGYTGGI